MPIPVVVKVYNDRSFEFVTKSPPAAALLKQAAGIAKGSGVPNKEKVGKVTSGQIDEIVKMKMADLNARDVEHARRMIEGTARSMGLNVEGLELVSESARRSRESAAVGNHRTKPKRRKADNHDHQTIQTNRAQAAKHPGQERRAVEPGRRAC